MIVYLMDITHVIQPERKILLYMGTVKRRSD